MADRVQAIGGQFVPARGTPPGCRLIPLKSMSDVRRELQRLYRDARAGIIESSDASRLAYILATVGRVIEAESLEQRVTAIENSMEAT